MKRNRKPRRLAGFTLAETLLAVLILLLVSVIVATGVPVAKNAYEKVVLGANAQMLLSTAASALRNEVGTAYGKIEIENVTRDGESYPALVYTSSATGARAALYLKDKVIWRQNYYQSDNLTAGDAPAGREGAGTRLVSEAAATKGLYVTYGEVEVTEDKKEKQVIVTFPGFVVCRGDDSNVLAKLGGEGNLKIRAVFAALDTEPEGGEEESDEGKT